MISDKESLSFNTYQSSNTSIKKNKLINNINNFKNIINLAIFSGGNKNNEKIAMGQRIIKPDENIVINNNKDDSSLCDIDCYEYGDVISDGTQNKPLKAKNDFTLLKCSLSFPVGFESSYSNEKAVDETIKAVDEELSTIEFNEINQYEKNCFKKRQNSIISTSSKTKQETLELLLKSINKLTSSSDLSSKYKMTASQSTTMIRNSSFLNNFDLNHTKENIINSSRKVSFLNEGESL